MHKNIYFVRHGKAGRTRTAGGVADEELTFEGVAQAIDAAVYLRETCGLDEQATVLTSSAPRAEQTARIITGIIGIGYGASELVEVSGNNPKGVESLDQMLGYAVRLAGITKPLEELTASGLVVVAHLPVMAIINGEHPEEGFDIKNGAVIEYAPGSWDPKYYKPQYLPRDYYDVDGNPIL